MTALFDSLAWTLIHFLWQGAAIALVAKLLLFTLRHRSANLRYLVALAALGMMAVSALVTFVSFRESPRAVIHPVVAPAGGVPAIVPITVELEVESAVGASVELPLGLAAASSSKRAEGLDWTRLLSLVWFGGVTLLALWRGLGLLEVARLRRHSVAAPPLVVANFENLRRAMNLGRGVSLRLSEIARSPVVVGVVRPLVLLPSALLTGLTPEQLHAVLAHELAHVRRRDYLVNLLQTAIETIFFFHPAVWWVSSTIRREREYCCDDLAVAECASPDVFAVSLGKVAEFSVSDDALPPLAMAANGHGEVARRIARLLNPNRRSLGGASWVPPLLMVGIAVALVLTRQVVDAAPPEGEEEVAGEVERGRILDREGRVLAEVIDGSRHYPFESVASHVIGYVSPIRDGGVEGRSGIEKTAEETLKAGGDLQLTLDLEKQFVVEKALRSDGIGRGAVVVIDPANGDVIAMASVPSTDPNIWVSGIRQKKWETLTGDRTHPLLNRSVSGYAPGSAVKIVTGLAFDNPRRYHACEGYVQFGNRKLRCWKEEGHGSVGLSDALTQSCNCYFYTAGNRAGLDRLHEVGSLFGFGSETGIETSGELDPIFPNTDFLRRTGRSPSSMDSAITAIGQGYVLVSPLQLASAAGVFASEGMRHSPRLLLDREAPDPVDVFTEVSEEAFDVVRAAMRRVVTDADGTAPRAGSELIEIAGKTGTALWWRTDEDKIKHKDLLSHFVGFAPFDEPSYAISVFVQGGSSGGTVAAPVARKILERFAELDAGGEIEVSPLPPAEGHFDAVGSIE